MTHNVGNLRWRAPVDPNTTIGTQNATSVSHNVLLLFDLRLSNFYQWGSICLGLGQTASATISEDCLFINVYAPQTATPESKLPVWFFIQGGGYNTNSNYNVNGTKVVQQSNNSIVMVGINYRVAMWGFLASEKVRADGDLNAGLLDQRKAMEWVQRYIHLVSALKTRQGQILITDDLLVWWRSSACCPARCFSRSWKCCNSSHSIRWSQ
jgi:acetylcholinesterase